MQDENENCNIFKYAKQATKWTRESNTIETKCCNLYDNVNYAALSGYKGSQDVMVVEDSVLWTSIEMQVALKIL